MPQREHEETISEVLTSHGRVFWFDINLSLEYIRQELENQGYAISMTKTMRQYGLRYSDITNFVASYKDEFGLNDMRTIWDIRLRELVNYKQRILGIALQ